MAEKIRDASAFKQLKENEDKTSLEKFINREVYEKFFDEGKYPAIVYLNTLETDEISPREFTTRLSELGFVCTNEKKGADKVIKVKIR